MKGYQRHFSAVKKSWNRSGFIIYSHFKESEFKEFKGMESSNLGTWRIPIFIRRYTLEHESGTSPVKNYIKRLRVEPRGRASTYKTFLSTAQPPPPPPTSSQLFKGHIATPKFVPLKLKFKYNGDHLHLHPCYHEILIGRMNINCKRPQTNMPQNVGSKEDLITKNTPNRTIRRQQQQQKVRSSLQPISQIINGVLQ